LIGADIDQDQVVPALQEKLGHPGADDAGADHADALKTRRCHALHCQFPVSIIARS